MKELLNKISKLLIENNIQIDNVKILTTIIGSSVFVFILLIIDFLIKKIIRFSFINLARKSKSKFDDLLITNKVPKYIARIIPLILFYYFIPELYFEYKGFEQILTKALKILIIIYLVFIVRSTIYTLKDYIQTIPKLKDKPIDSYIQVIMMIFWTVTSISILAIISERSFMEFITTIGAASAIIILVFKDTIMGFVASIQVSVNDMVRIGDWITFQKYGADGDVIEINLATVKVQNFDMTITTIPTYALISDSFKNWRGMTNSNGRRIKRSLNINFDSIRFLNTDDLNKLAKIDVITDYITKRSKDINSYNEENNINKDFLLNGKNLTNIGLFRKYLQTYIENHSAINKEMTIMVRQLSPSIHGVPLEIYAFSKDKVWVNYEYIVSDIFDHIIASTKYFDLHIYEMPSNVSLKNIKI